MRGVRWLLATALALITLMFTITIWAILYILAGTPKSPDLPAQLAKAEKDAYIYPIIITAITTIGLIIAATISVRRG